MSPRRRHRPALQEVGAARDVGRELGRARPPGKRFSARGSGARRVRLTAAAASSARSPQRSAVSTPSCSPPGSESTRRPSAPACAGTRGLAGHSPGRGRQRPRRPAPQRPGQPRLPVGDPDQRGAGDRPPYREAHWSVIEDAIKSSREPCLSTTGLSLHEHGHRREEKEEQERNGPGNQGGVREIVPKREASEPPGSCELGDDQQS